MYKTSLIATVVAMASAKTLEGKPAASTGDAVARIVYPDGETDAVQVDPNLYPAVFKWP